MSKQSLPLRRRVRRSRDRVLIAAARVAIALAGHTGLQRLLNLAERGGDVAYLLLRGPSRAAAEHIGLAFGAELSLARRQRLARAAYANVVRSFAELANIKEVKAQAETYFDVDGEEHLQAALADGRGALVVTGQIGNWELLAAYWAWRGTPVAVLAHRRTLPELQRLCVQFRAQQGVVSIPPESPSADESMRAITRRGGFLLAVVDQEPGAAKLPLPLFGRDARQPDKVARLAVRRALPILPTVIRRRPQRGHRITVRPPLVLSHSADARSQVRELARQLSDVLDSQVRANPAEWAWWRDRRRARLRQFDLSGSIQYTSGADPEY
jgi:KDO2-lipid IV(A) lauroyltransferase